MARRAGMVDYSKDGPGYKYVDKGAEQGDRGKWMAQYDPRSNTMWMAMEARTMQDAPFGTPASGVKVSKDYANKLLEKTGVELKADNGMIYTQGYSSMQTSQNGMLPNVDNTIPVNPRERYKNAEHAAEHFNDLKERYLGGKEEPVKQAEATTEKAAEPKTIGTAREQFTGKQFDVRKDTPGYASLKTASHEPEAPANFLVKEYASGHVTVVNSPRASEVGGYINGTKGLSDQLKAAGVEPIDLGEGNKGYDVTANVEFNDKGQLSLVADSIVPRANGIGTAAGFERQFEAAKEKADGNAASYEAEKADAEVDGPEVG